MTKTHCDSAWVLCKYDRYASPALLAWGWIWHRVPRRRPPSVVISLNPTIISSRSILHPPGCDLAVFLVPSSFRVDYIRLLARANTIHIQYDLTYNTTHWSTPKPPPPPQDRVTCGRCSRQPYNSGDVLNPVKKPQDRLIRVHSAA